MGFDAGRAALRRKVASGLGRSLAALLAYQLDLPVPLDQAQIAVFSIFGILAAAEIGISRLILLVLIGVLLAAGAGTFTLAFGLSSRDVARALSAGRYLRHDYRVGQEIAFGDVRGRISKIHSTSTTLDAGEGRSIRIPNHLLLGEIIIIYGEEDRHAAPAQPL